MKKVNLRDLAFFALTFNLGQNLTHQRRNCTDGIRQGEAFSRQQIVVRKARLNTLTDRPYRLFTRQHVQRIHDKIDYSLIELTNQPLIGAEHHHPCRPCLILFNLPQSTGFILRKTGDQAQLHRPVIIIQSTHRILVLSDTGCGHGLHRTHHGFQFSGAGDLAAQTHGGIAHDAPLPSGSA